MTLDDDSNPGAPDDRDLLRRFLAGERVAHRSVEHWAREIVRFRPYGIPRHEHDDIVQQSLGLLWRACSREDFALRHGLRAMLRKIVLARCVDRLRRQRPTEELEENLVDPGLDPEAAALKAERLSRVQGALQRIDERCREVIQLHFLDELPYADLAERMGVAQATARVRMFHCMKELRRLLDVEARQTEAETG